MSEKRQTSKIFVGGLSWETTDQRLRTYFENYGAVSEAFVSFDRTTGEKVGLYPHLTSVSNGGKCANRWASKFINTSILSSNLLSKHSFVLSCADYSNSKDRHTLRDRPRQVYSNSQLMSYSRNEETAWFLSLRKKIVAKARSQVNCNRQALPGFAYPISL